MREILHRAFFISARGQYHTQDMQSLGNIFSFFKIPLCIDLRSLALFRVCFGFVLITDLCIRAQSLTAHYSDDGIWPRAEAALALPELGFSFHLLSGSWGFQVFLFSIMATLTSLIIIGYWTRVSSFLLWIMLVSLNHRNYNILQTSDTLMLALLFWSMFLPVGARYSVDAALNQTTRNNTECSVASAALILQVLSVYFFGALLKTGDTWLVGKDAVYHALHFSAYSSNLGVWVGEFLSHDSQRLLTQFVYLAELYGPLLILSPILTTPLRYIVVPMLMAMHVGFALLLNVGIYPYLSITSLLILTPGSFWDYFQQRIKVRQQNDVRIYYDEPCDFCKKVCLLLKIFFLPSSTEIVPATAREDIQEILTRANSWVVEDIDGQHYIRWQAMLVIMKRSWFLAPFVFLADNPPMRALGEYIYRSVTANRELLGRISAILLPYNSATWAIPKPINYLLGGLLCLVLLANIDRLKTLQFENPDIFSRVTNALLLNQNWTMFAPDPGRSTVWLFVEGFLDDGTRVDVYRDLLEAPNKNKPADASGYYDGYRWRKYFNSVDPISQWPKLGRYYCSRWNESHPPLKIHAVRGYALWEHNMSVDENGLYKTEYDLSIVGNLDCKL